MDRREIRTLHESLNCALCGRNLLRGEIPEVFIVGGSQRQVCELCRSRALQEGWVPEGSADSFRQSRSRLNSRGSFFNRFQSWRDGSRLKRKSRGEEALPQASETGQRQSDASQTTFTDTVERGIGLESSSSSSSATVTPPNDRRRARQVGAGTFTDRPREPRHVHAIPVDNELKFARALELFNASGNARTVAGVARSLGSPFVSVRLLEDSPSIVVITAAWELCWYRYEVDLAEESEYSAVAQVAQGADMAELELEERSANAVANPDGSLVLQGTAG